MAGEEARWARQSFTLFAFLWAMGMLFHQAQWAYWRDGWPDVLFATAIMLVLVKPSSLWRVGLLFLAGLGSAVNQSPWLSNHFMFVALISLPVVAALGVELVRGRGQVDAASFYLRFGPPVRIMLLVLYFFTVLHKVNWDFLNPELSCGAHYYRDIARAAPLLPMADWAMHVAIWGALLTELLMCLLPAIPQTRLLGVVLAVSFHFVLGLKGHQNFSAIAYAALFLFLPANTPDLLMGRLNTLGVTRSGLWATAVRWAPLASKVGTIVALALGVVMLLTVGLEPRDYVTLLRDPSVFGRDYLARALKWLFVPYTFAVLGLFVLIATAPGRVRTPLARGMHPLMWVFPLILIANAMMPYFGLKTEASFTMFSNLRTEVEPNHVIFRDTPWIWDFSTDLVTVIDSSDPKLQKLATKGWPIPAFEIRSYVARQAARGNTDIRLTLEYNGQRHTMERAGLDPVWSAPVPTLARRLTYFRWVQLGAANTCEH